MGDYTSWKVGDRVVCVDDSPSRARRVSLGLRSGAIYTIREIGCFFDDVDVGIRLVEVKIPEWWDGEEGAVAAERFRRVQPRKTSIEIFHRILSKPHIKIREDA